MCFPVSSADVLVCDRFSFRGRPRRCLGSFAFVFDHVGPPVLVGPAGQVRNPKCLFTAESKWMFAGFGLEVEVAEGVVLVCPLHQGFGGGGGVFFTIQSSVVW